MRVQSYAMHQSYWKTALPETWIIPMPDHQKSRNCRYLHLYQQACPTQTMKITVNLKSFQQLELLNFPIGFKAKTLYQNVTWKTCQPGLVQVLQRQMYQYILLFYDKGHIWTVNHNARLSFIFAPVPKSNRQYHLNDHSSKRLLKT